MKDGHLEKHLLSVIGKSGGKDLLIEAAELALDSVFENGVAKDIPVIGTVAKLYSVAIGTQGYLFTKKIKKFLTELALIPYDERIKFAKRLEADPKQGERVSEVVLTFIDKLDDIEKAPLLARAFSRYITEDYDLTTFHRLSIAIDRCFIFDLRHLDDLENPVGLDGYVGDMLVSAGLATIHAIPQVHASTSKTLYKISNLGELFLQVVIKGKSRWDQ